MRVLSGKCAVVTGGSRGIGRAIVERLAGDGAAVVFNYARSSEAAAHVVRGVRDAGGRAHAVQIDLAEPGAADQLMAVAAEHLDGLDILVNNAALDFGTPRPIADTDEQLWDDTMTVNAKSAFLTVRHAARNMRNGGRDHQHLDREHHSACPGQRSLCREQGSNRAAHQGRSSRARRPGHHGQRGLSGRHRHRTPPPRQSRGGAHPGRQDNAAGPPREA